MMPKLVIRLKGGLGNQLFQYAAGRALALRNCAVCTLDARSGFARDKIYRRTYELDRFPILASQASGLYRLHFELDRILRKLDRTSDAVPVREYRWGNVLYETTSRYLTAVGEYGPTITTWMEGHWQTERYFLDATDIIREELSPPEPIDSQFLSMAKRIESSSSIAVGVRRFEEVHSGDRSRVGGLVPYQFYEEAAEKIVKTVSDPVFYVFCTKLDEVIDTVRLPGDIVYVTPDHGYRDAVQTLYLLSRCQHHILSNSTLYWWGAWLSEQHHRDQVIIAANAFTNRDGIPKRWHTLGLNRDTC